MIKMTIKKMTKIIKITEVIEAEETIKTRVETKEITEEEKKIPNMIMIDPK